MIGPDHDELGTGAKRTEGVRNEALTTWGPSRDSVGDGHLLSGECRGGVKARKVSMPLDTRKWKY